MATAIVENLDYSEKNSMTGLLKYMYALPQGGQSALSLDTTTTQGDLIIPGSVVFVPSECYLEYEINIGQAAADFRKKGIVIGSTLAHFKSFKTETESGKTLCDLQDCNRVYKILNKFLPYEKVKTRSCVRMSSGTSSSVDVCSLSPVVFGSDNAGKTYAITTTELAVVDPISVIPSKASSNTALDDNKFHPSARGSILGEYYIDVGDGAEGDAKTNMCSTADCYLRFKIHLGDLLGSFWSINKNVYLGDEIRIKATFDQLNKLVFTTTGAAAAAFPPLLTGATAITTLPTLTTGSFRLVYAQQVSPMIRAEVKARFEQGVVMNLPWVSRDVVNLTASIANSHERVLTSGYGSQLKRVICAVYSAGDAITRYLNFNNSASALWSQIRTYIDNDPLQNDNVNMSLQEVYNQQESMLEGCCVGGNAGFNYNAFLVNDFTGYKARDWIKKDIDNSGLDLSSKRDFKVDINCGASANKMLVIYMTNKKLQISKEGGIMVL